jgi:hypothetical protein
MTDPHSRDAGPRGAEERYCYPEGAVEHGEQTVIADTVTASDGE